MSLNLSNYVCNKPSTARDAKTGCLAKYIQSFDEDLRFEEAEEKNVPWFVRLLTSSKVLDFRHLQYGQARAHLASARAYLQSETAKNAIDEILSCPGDTRH